MGSQNRKKDFKQDYSKQSDNNSFKQNDNSSFKQSESTSFKQNDSSSFKQDDNYSFKQDDKFSSKQSDSGLVSPVSPVVKPIDQSQSKSQSQPQSSQNSKDFEKNLNQVKVEVEHSRETIENLIASGRKLAQEYTSAKRVELESYMDKFLETSQVKITSAIDQTLTNLNGSIERTLGKSKGVMSEFFVDFGKSVQGGINKIDARPLLPVLAALVCGAVAGIFLGNRKNLVEGFSDLKNTAKSKYDINKAA